MAMAMAAAAQSSSSSFSFIPASPCKQTTSSSSNTALAPICSGLGKVSQLSISKFGQYSRASVRALQVKAACWISQNQRKKHKQRRTLLQAKKTAIQFIEGRDEETVPEVKLTKSKDGNNGVATFTFVEPSVFEETSKEVGDITGLYLIDDEGVIRSVDVSAKFVNGRPSRIEARHVMRSPAEWDRFMRFMERYATDNGLQFIKK